MKLRMIAVSVLLASRPLPSLAADFADYPAEIYSGKITLPDFGGAQKDFAFFETRLGLAAKRTNPEFAGSWVIEQIGCGSSCTSTYAIDHRSGAIAVLPLGGEEQQNVILYHRPSSSLMKATWFEGFWMDGPCMIGEWVMRDGSFEEISVVQHEPREDCNH